MKNISLVLLTVMLCYSGYAQNDYRKPASFGFSFFYNDFKAGTDIRRNGLGNLLRSNQFLKTKRMNTGISVNYLKGLTNKIDFTSSFGLSDGQFAEDNQTLKGQYGSMMEATAGLNFKLLTDQYFLVPFLTAGVGIERYKGGYFGATAPLGVGAQFNISDDLFLLLNSQYRAGITEVSSNHFYHGFTIAARVGPKRNMEPKVVEVPVMVVTDRDGDGVVDSLDACPDTVGLPTLMGCPDRDGDGIADKDDTCPDVAGVAKYQGCPVPDTDKDGINDEEDKCPNVAGTARYQGCPVPDTDNDGVNDEEDKCPNEAGVASNFGCPEIKQEIIEKVNLAAKNVFFATNSSKLLAKSFPALKNVAKILKDNPNFNIDVEGHTDSTGSYELNTKLSNYRAASVAEYLKTTGGVEEGRITSKGFGPDQPIAPNKTAAGRAKNRRVEMKLRNY